MVRLVRVVREEFLDLLVLWALLARMEILVLLALLDLLVHPERKESRDPAVLLDSRVCQVHRVPPERRANLVIRVVLVKSVLMVLLVQEVTEVSPESVEVLDLLAPPVLEGPLVLLVMMVLRESPEPPGPLVVWGPLDCRECLESAAPEACLEPEETEVMVDPRALMELLVKMACVE